MKIITFVYNKDQAAVAKSHLLSDNTFAVKDIFRLAPPDRWKAFQENLAPVSIGKIEEEYIRAETWQ